MRTGKRLSTLITAFVFALCLLPANLAYGQDHLSEDDIKSILEGYPYFDPNAETCGQVVPPGTIETTAYQRDNTRAIIGIAKTLNLGKQGALIGIMVGIAESGLKNYANSGTYTNDDGVQPYVNTQLGPISLSLPHDAVGHDNDSVGIMQQRAVDGHWGPVNPDTNLAENIKWLMTPTYAAEAFFANPAGKTETKALVNVSGWENMDPWEAAQKVQVSAYDGNPRKANNFSSVYGGNYRDRLAVANSLLEEHWDVAGPIPLPVPLAGEGSAPGGDRGTEITCAPTGSTDKIFLTIFEYSWDTYRPAGNSYALERKPAYASAVSAARQRTEYIGSCDGVDCGGFVTRVMRDSGADPEYNSDECNTRCQQDYLRRNSQGPGAKYTRVATEGELKGGEIAVRNNGTQGHTFFYVGKITGPNGEPFHGNSASSSQCERAPMASGSDTFSLYEWYRLN